MREATCPERWYNTIEGIRQSIKTLAGFNELVKARHKAGYKRSESLKEFIVRGRWKLDSCGNTMKAIDGQGDFYTPPPAGLREVRSLYAFGYSIR